jgi:RNA polymerase sigma-70 factor (ECF subfamily)
MLSESELIKGCKEFNSKAQQELYERYSRKMSAVCYCYAGSKDDAKDILHEGFIKVFSKIKDYKGEGSFEGWLRKIMVNTSINFLTNKKKLSFKNLQDMEEAEEIADELTEEELEYFDFSKEELSEAINQLKEEYRLVFTLFCFDNYSHKEISQMLGILEDTCRSKLRRARNQLKKYLLSKRKF